MAMTRIPLVDLRRQNEDLRDELDEAIGDVVSRASFILGEDVEAFEAEWADHVTAAGAVGVASGTAALHLALLACGIGDGDEVVTTAHTFFATAEAIIHAGARPVFVDIDPATYTIDPAAVEAAITPATRAVMPVHLYGQPAAMGDLLEICERRGLYLIEDAAQAHGAEYDGIRCGSIGHVACFSFYPGKNLGAFGDAGAVTSNDADVLARVRRLRDHGRSEKYSHIEVGYGERLDTLQAAILRVKLRHLEDWTIARRSHAERYSELLSDADIGLPYEAERARHVYHLYVIRTRRRDELRARLAEAGVSTGIHYPIPLHRQPALRDHDHRAPLERTDEAAAEILSLPLYPELRPEEVEYIADRVRSFS